MNQDILKKEMLGLRVGGCIEFILVCATITFALLTHSTSILFDATYTFIIFASTIIGIFVVKMTSKNKDNKYPYGKYGYENIFALFKSLLLVCISIYFFIVAIVAMVNAQSSLNDIWYPDFEIFLIYTVVMSVLCLTNMLSYYFINKSINFESTILKVQFKAALMDMLYDVAVGLGLLLGAIFLKDQSAQTMVYRLYIDKSLLIMMVFIATPQPLSLLINQIFVFTNKRLLKEQEILINDLIEHDNQGKYKIDDIFMQKFGKHYTIVIYYKIESEISSKELMQHQKHVKAHVAHEYDYANVMVLYDDSDYESYND